MEPLSLLPSNREYNHVWLIHIDEVVSNIFKDLRVLRCHSSVGFLMGKLSAERVQVPKIDGHTRLIIKSTSRVSPDQSMEEVYLTFVCQKDREICSQRSRTRCSGLFHINHVLFFYHGRSQVLQSAWV